LPAPLLCLFFSGHFLLLDDAKLGLLAGLAVGKAAMHLILSVLTRDKALEGVFSRRFDGASMKPSGHHLFQDFAGFGAEVVVVGFDGLAKDATEDRRAVGALMDCDRLRGRPSRLALSVITQRALPSRRGAKRQIERPGLLTEDAGSVCGDAVAAHAIL
jgi:hypothetical protein